jgi:hypothetical protein
MPACADILSLALRRFGITTTGVLWGVASMTRAATDLTETATNEEVDAFAATGNLKSVGKPDGGGTVSEEVALRAVFAWDAMPYETSTL